MHFLVFINYLWLFCAERLIVGASNSINMTDIKTLTFYKDKFTTARRNDPIPQLRCVGGSAKCFFTPKLIQCDNKASKGTLAIWDCKTNMKNEYTFRNIQILCEGYDYPEDTYILIGSCGLQYTLEYANEPVVDKSKNQNSYKFGLTERIHFAKMAVFFTILTLLVIYPLYYVISHCWLDLRARAVYKPKVFQKASRSRGQQPKPTYHYDGYQPTNVKTFISMKRPSSDVDEFGNSQEDFGVKFRKNKAPPPYPVPERPPYPVGFRPDFYPDPIADIGFRPEIFPSLTDYQKASQQQPLYHQCDSFSRVYSPTALSYETYSDQVESSWSDEFPVSYGNFRITPKTTISTSESKIKIASSAPPLWESQ